VNPLDFEPKKTTTNPTETQPKNGHRALWSSMKRIQPKPSAKWGRSRADVMNESPENCGIRAPLLIMLLASKSGWFVKRSISRCYISCFLSRRFGKIEAQLSATHLQSCVRSFVLAPSLAVQSRWRVPGNALLRAACGSGSTIAIRIVNAIQ